MEMKISFGISTTYKEMSKLKEVVDSIHNLQIPKDQYEILIIGDKKLDPENNVSYIYFDESEKKGWITRKKNILGEESRFDNLVICNDYFIFQPEFYKNWVEFGEDWDVASNAQQYITGERVFHDWCTFDHPNHPWGTMIEYDDWSHTRYQFQAGGYVVVKKHILKQYPFNESLVWGKEEDVEWSKRIRQSCKYVCNGKSIVKHNKHHHTYPYRHHRIIKTKVEHE